MGFVLDPSADIFLSLKSGDENNGLSSPLTAREPPSLFSGNRPANQNEGVFEINVQASSRQLALASAVFKRVLFGNSPIEPWIIAGSRVTFFVEVQNIEAFVILLSIIHGNGQATPPTVGLSMLTSLAVLVDRYDLHETAEIFCLNWMRKLKKPAVETLTRDTIDRIFICWVFQESTLFKKLTRLAQRESVGRIDEQFKLHFTMPQNIVGTLQRLI